MACRDKEVAMIHSIESGWLRTSDTLDERERRQRRRRQSRNGKGVKMAGEPQAQVVLKPGAVTPGTFDLGTFDLVA
jgi:hypothetical protein